jgi:hypothetical protein
VLHREVRRHLEREQQGERAQLLAPAGRAPQVGAARERGHHRAAQPEDRPRGAHQQLRLRRIAEGRHAEPARDRGDEVHDREARAAVEPLDRAAEEPEPQQVEPQVQRAHVHERVRDVAPGRGRAVGAVG